MTTAEDEIHAQLLALANEKLSISLLIVSGHRTPEPAIFEVPISSRFAQQLLMVCTGTIVDAVEAELRPAEAGFRPAPNQWLWNRRPDGPVASLDDRVCRGAAEQYERGRQFGRSNLLVLRLRRPDGTDAARLYQGFSPEKALQRSKVVGWWTGERFDSTDADPLVIDRSLRLMMFGDLLVMQSATAYENLFGPLPDLRQQAELTYQATLGTLDIIGGDELLKACTTDINMMRKLISIKAKLGEPGYVTSIEMPKIVEFLESNPKIDVLVDRTGPEPKLVHSSSVQRRWSLLKLLDDDYLRSDLTNINYEANSKTEI